MTRAWGRPRARHPQTAIVVAAGSWGARPRAARFFNRPALTLVAGGAVGGVLAASGMVVTGALVGVGTLIAAPFLGGQ